MAGLGVWLLGGAPGGADGTLSAKASDGAVCITDPAKISGPFPVDSTNICDGQTVNALTESVVMRGKTRAAYGGLTGQAEGVPLLPDMTLVNRGPGCACLAGHAVYFWHADADGHFSRFVQPDQTCLRAVAVTDHKGRAQMQSIVPGCYDGRWSQIHFEVLAGLEAAVSGKAARMISQFALSQIETATVYASPVNPGRVSRAGNMMLGFKTPEQITAQTLTLRRAVTGHTATGTVGMIAT